MKCFQCGQEIEKGEEIKCNHRFLCEDCYLDNTIVVRTCDPESVRIAKNMESLGIASGKLSPEQSRVVEIVKSKGGVTPEYLLKELDMRPDELERVLASLRHIRRIKGEKRGDERYITLY